MPTITKIYKFCAAHQYGHEDWSESRNFEVFGEDAKVHGHNYQLEISVTGPINPDTGFIVDLGVLNKVVNKEVISIIDHSMINKDIPWFEGKQPSTENLVIFIWEQLETNIPAPVILKKVKLQETPTIYSEYYGNRKEF